MCFEEMLEIAALILGLPLRFYQRIRWIVDADNYPVGYYIYYICESPQASITIELYESVKSIYGSHSYLICRLGNEKKMKPDFKSLRELESYLHKLGLTYEYIL